MTELSPLDRLSLIMERPERPLDFAVILRLDPSFDPAQLERGAESAAVAFPRSAARIEGDRWVPAARPAIGGAIDLEAWLASPFDPRRVPAIEQRWFDGTLVTRSHHAAADLLSVIRFLDVQLAPEPTEPEAPPVLRRHSNPVRKSRFSQAGPSRKLWTHSSETSRERRVMVVSLEAAPLRERLDGSFTYNDLLGAAMLRAIGEFQQARGAKRDRLSLWFPIDIRTEPFKGFGNGASRIRIYDRSAPDASMRDRCLSFREQVVWSKEHGEWAVPENHPIFSLPAPLIRAYFRRPWVDMGTVMFSHLERIAKDGDRLPGVRSIEVVSMLDRRHPLGIAAITLRGRTMLSFTWDPAQLQAQDVRLIADQFERAVRDA